MAYVCSEARPRQGRKESCEGPLLRAGGGQGPLLRSGGSQGLCCTWLPIVLRPQVFILLEACAHNWMDGFIPFAEL
jgi:hypothetical protein